MPGPMIAAHTVCEPAQSKCTWTFHKSRFVCRKNVADQPEHPDQALAFRLTVRTLQSKHTVCGRTHFASSQDFMLLQLCLPAAATLCVTVRLIVGLSRCLRKSQIFLTNIPYPSFRVSCKEQAKYSIKKCPNPFWSPPNKFRILSLSHLFPHFA